MSFLSGIASTLGGFAASSAMSWAAAEKQARLNLDVQRKLMEKANEYNVENYQHRYQWQMDDMKAAGLNPILASATLGAGNVGYQEAGHASVSAPQVQAKLNLAQDLADLAYKKAETSTAQEQASLLSAQAGKVSAEEANTRALTEKIKEDTALSRRNAEKAGVEMQKMQHDMEIVKLGRWLGDYHLGTGDRAGLMKTAGDAVYFPFKLLKFLGSSVLNYFSGPFSNQSAQEVYKAIEKQAEQDRVEEAAEPEKAKLKQEKIKEHKEWLKEREFEDLMLPKY
ncbi:minor capsid protein [Capybara microvirus Cap1_SP_230]|nr:minor capsid protein [Capybara microvirus Cap1_SP_230]